MNLYILTSKKTPTKQTIVNIIFSQISFYLRAMQYIILIIGMNMVNSRKLTADLLFGISSSEGSDPADLKISKKLMAIQGSIYAALGEKLPAFVEQCIKLDESASIDILAVLDTRTSQCTGPTPILAKILEAIQQKVYNQVGFFLVHSLSFTVK